MVQFSVEVMQFSLNGVLAMCVTLCVYMTYYMFVCFIKSSTPPLPTRNVTLFRQIKKITPHIA